MKTSDDDVGISPPTPREGPPIARWSAEAPAHDFEVGVRHNVRDFVVGGRKFEALERLGLRCVPASPQDQQISGTVYRIARAPGFYSSYLARCLRRRARSGMIASFTVVRHGATVHNHGGVLCGSWFGSDVGIDEEEQTRLRRIRVPRDALIAHSPLARARQTAQVLSRTTIRPTQHGSEMCFGAFEGRRLEELIRGDHRFRRLFVHGDTLAGFPGAECFADVVLRAGRLIDELIDTAASLCRQDVDVFFVGHAMINHALRILADELHDDERGHYLCNGLDPRACPMDNGSLRTLYRPLSG